MTDPIENDGRLSFKEAVAFVLEHRQPVFSAQPVFGERTDDENQTAEGVRIFIIEPDPEEDGGDWRMRFIAGPFFASVYAANDIIAPEDVPESMRELRFMPTRYEEDWFVGQLQVLIQRLVQASAQQAAQMPDYLNMPSRGADEDTVFPVTFLGREDGSRH